MDGTSASSESGEPAANGAKHEEQPFDPSRMIGIIKRKALVKELAAAYHAECMASCKELLQLQRMWEKSSYLLTPKSQSLNAIGPWVVEAFIGKMYKRRKDHVQAKAPQEQYAEAKMPEELISWMPKSSKRRKR
ncbi:hypothetical protein EJB05_05822 [Eragrostis curvula]|uniref:Uncharacterized protein n=1 Tax=Eragrostis curvula TaxID=38414 RepID=A0A5J9WEC1_9POAL|nr:hypothetical protein EJB05_05822 [Eragrostis curvula]